MSKRVSTPDSTRDEETPSEAPRDRVWLTPLVIVSLIGLCSGLLWFTPKDHDEIPPEPVDPMTRHACRDWQVVVAVTGVGELTGADREQRTRALEDFFPRAEKAAKVKEAEQASFLAIVEAIAGARRLRDAHGRGPVGVALEEFAADLAAVTTVCEKT